MQRYYGGNVDITVLLHMPINTVVNNKIVVCVRKQTEDIEEWPIPKGDINSWT